MSSTCNSNLERDLLHSESLTSFSNLTNEEKEKKYKYLVKFFYVRGVSTKGAFNNYVDKMGGGQKMSVFVYSQGIKPVHAGGGQKWQNSVHVVVESPLMEKCTERSRFRKSVKFIYSEKATKYMNFTS